jgi:hypothetical protein
MNEGQRPHPLPSPACRFVKETFMASIKAPATVPVSRCYRLTARGRTGLEMLAATEPGTGLPPRYLYDVLEMCGSGVWFEQLQQFMPPRSLDEALRSLLAMGLIEAVAPEQVQQRLPLSRPRRASIFGDLSPG